jgi:hypothetical protein
MEGSCSTGQSPQWALVPMEEEEVVFFRQFPLIVLSLGAHFRFLFLFLKFDLLYKRFFFSLFKELLEHGVWQLEILEVAQWL